MTYFAQFVQIQKEMKLCNQARVLISKETLLYLHPKSSFFCFVSDLVIFSYHSITKFVFNENLREARWSAFFHAKVIVRKRKAWFRLRVSRILFAAKHSCTTLRISRPLFVGTYLQVKWWAFGQWKGRKHGIAW